MLEATVSVADEAAERLVRLEAWRAGLESLGEDVAGTVFAIEYEDSKKNATRRRISLGAVKADDKGRVYLQAFCLERRAVRSFRLDRVRSVIDVDGEVHDTPRYFRDILRIDVPEEVFTASEAPLPRMQSATVAQASGALADTRFSVPGRAQRHAARNGLRILSALARSDGFMDDAELEVILDYIAHRADFDGINMDEADRAALLPYLRRQYPTTDVLSRCLEAVEEESPSQQRLLIRHAIQLIDADGVQDPAEFDLLLRIQKQLG